MWSLGASALRAGPALAGTTLSPNPLARPTPIPGSERTLERLAEWSFLLLVAALPWTIAPMGITTALCAAATLALWLRRGYGPPRTPVAWPTLTWFLALALCAATALDRGASLPRLTKAMFPLLVPLAADRARLPRPGRRALVVFLASAGLAALFGIVLYVLRGPGFPARARGAVGHYMTFAGQLLIATSVAAGIAVCTRSARWRWGALAVAATGAVALAATYTRSSWLGLLAALATLLGLVRPRWLPALAGAVVLLLLLAPDSYRARAFSIVDPHDPTNLERTYMWRAGAAMFRDHPVTGVGLEDLRPVYDRYKPPEARERTGHLHSVPVQIAASMGSVGLVAFALLYGALVITAARGLRRDLAAGGVAAGLRAGVVALLVGFLVAGLFEWNFGDEELLYPLFTLVGLAWAARDWEAAAREAAVAAGREGR